MSEKNPLEIARKLVELGQAEGAARAYALALQNGIEEDPASELEAAVCVLQFGRDYQLPYTTLHSLHRRGLFRQETYSIMTEAFYEPNVKDQKSRYERNCKQLKKYLYFFRQDFPAFEDLPILFYPYDDSKYIPYYPAEDRFGDLIDFKEPVIKHYFFKNLDDPILAEDIFSQYELEYLNDNVRKSEWVARENHIYLHYTDWAVFCAYLQCWNLNSLLGDEKFVFLMEDEISQYPIDFKTRFGLDYSRYTVRPIGIREVNRLIWHTQLSAHNGGDFFNEIFDAHPNLLVMPSMMLSSIEEVTADVKKKIEQIKSNQQALQATGDWAPHYLQELYLMKGRTDKDLMVSTYLNDEHAMAGLDPNSRIAPALFFQPHFGYISYKIDFDEKKRAALRSEQYEKIRQSPVFRNFKYIKAFTPLRRFTTSYGATIRFVDNQLKGGAVNKKGIPDVVIDVLSGYVLNRSYMTDPEDRLFKDSVLVRFEDGKLNPTATFTALAEFLDIPYTESLTYCSEYGNRDFHTEGNVDGFDPATVYRTYDDYTNDTERVFLEFFLRDAYEEYGYGFRYYDGGEMTEERLQELLNGCTVINEFMTGSHRKAFRVMEKMDHPELSEEQVNANAEEKLRLEMENEIRDRAYAAHVLLHGLRFVNLKGQPLQFMKKLELDPALLEQPLYH